MEKTNTFAALEAAKNSNERATIEPVAQVAPKQRKEISIENFSDRAPADEVKYERPDLNGQEDVIEQFQVFEPDPHQDELVASKTGTSEYYKVQVILTYASKNKDGLNNREYLSGSKAFVQKNGAVGAPNYWYDGAETQVAALWELVAKHLKIEPKEMSPRQFVAFLNSKPKVKVVSTKYKYFTKTPKPTDPKHTLKNMPGEFL